MLHGNFFQKEIRVCSSVSYKELCFASEERLGPTQTSKMESTAAMAKIRQLLFQRSQS